LISIIYSPTVVFIIVPMPTLPIKEDVTLRYETLGEGDPLVLIHGLGANLAFWYFGIATILASSYRVILYDLRGHGESSTPATGYTLFDMAADLSQLLQHLQIEKAHFVGHSYGARIALHYGLHHPEQVHSLTLADTQVGSLQAPLTLQDWPYWQIWKQQLSAQGVVLPEDGSVISFQLLSQLNRLAPNLTHGGARKPSLKRRTMGQRSAEQWDYLLSNATIVQELEEDSSLTVEKLRQCPIPTFSFFGEYSHCVPTGEQLQRLMPRCESKIASGVGHFHPAVQPREFSEALQQFLSQFPLNANRGDCQEVLA
jgi:pimeloyl-ACP methyl ester carboxylesterase